MALIVDSSVWIDYFNGKSSLETDTLHQMLGNEEILVGDLVLTEVLQGFRSDADFRQARKLLQLFPIVPMLGTDMAMKAANNYRILRKQGVTVRKTIDVMIATYCIEHGLVLLCSDKDFVPMTHWLGLQLAKG